MLVDRVLAWTRGYQARVVSSTCILCSVRVHLTIPTFMRIMGALFLGQDEVPVVLELTLAH